MVFSFHPASYSISMTFDHGSLVFDDVSSKRGHWYPKYLLLSGECHLLSLFVTHHSQSMPAISFLRIGQQTAIPVCACNNWMTGLGLLVESSVEGSDSQPGTSFDKAPTLNPTLLQGGKTHN